MPRPIEGRLAQSVSSPKDAAGEADMRASIGVLDHYNLRTRKFSETVRFYEDVLGLEQGPRPNFPIPGAWMYSDGHPAVHLVDISATAEPQQAGSGALHHVAFVSRGFKAMKERLASKGVAFNSVEVAGGEIWQIFVTDPNGVVIELNYHMKKEAD
jgi:catechol 2,3-dioxygenase-like lactoylglutathione lyase family enzyme